MTTDPDELARLRRLLRMAQGALKRIRDGGPAAPEVARITLTAISKLTDAKYAPPDARTPEKDPHDAR